MRLLKLPYAEKNNFRISLKTAKRLKLSLTDLTGDKLEGRRVMGVDTVTGLPRDGNVSCYTVTEAVTEQLNRIALEIRKFLERTPPQVQEKIRQEGIYFTRGGEAHSFSGLDRFFSDRLGCPVQLFTAL